MRALLIFSIVCLISCRANGQETKKYSRLHYFYNSGWLIETDQHILIFDFIPNSAAGISLTTLQQKILDTKTNKRILIFVTHGHEDHFDESIFDLASRRNVSIILGWEPEKKPNIERLFVVKPGDSLISRNYAVYAHQATDEGSGLLVKIDGLTIYHAGDHALWAEALLTEFTDQLTYIKNKATAIDIAFLPAARGMFVKCVSDSLIEKGLKLSAEILKPATLALQHIGCADKLPQYQLIKERLTAIKTNWVVPGKYDQSF
ncbi:MAG TPA: hypothetical protein VF476_01535 [Chitinophagaceae bacterium]